MGLIMLQPDLGTTVMLTFILGSMILFAGLRRYLVIGTTVIGIASAPLAWFFLAPHQQDRIKAFINPESDPMGIGYNAIQSMVAVGSGRIFGKGYRLGTQTALKYLPERHSDFAFSVLGEEWGFFGCMIVLLLFLFIVIWALRIASQSRDRFGCLAGIGIASMIFWHLTVNVAMTLGAFPVVGIPIPFLSYGGSFLITTFAGIGLLMSIEGRRLMF
jgi:rod shape determining protein RodA